MTSRDFLPALLALAILAALPFVGLSGSLLNLLIFTLIVTMTAQGWNILGGFGGQTSFGHAAFFGTGAYTTAILQITFDINAWVGLLAGILVGAAVGAFIGAVSFRSGLRGSYFALVTLAFAEVLRICANSAPFTGGAAGLLVPIDYGAANLQFEDRRIFALILVGFVFVALLVTRWLERSRFGAHLVAVRENEEAAQALGVDVFRVKLGAIVLSAAVTAAAGALYTQNYLFIDANVAYGTWISIEALFAAIVGGLGTMLGPLLGAVVLHGLSEVTKAFSGDIPGLDLAVFGVILVLTVAFAPSGIYGLGRRLFARRTRREDN
ncbi:branched-chain amino acid ABC transporter permease [Acuticoccus sp. I52.16.1]|uniref:branched-chain amino acid ABC transporter permease n=1 Tax=Acuticoccus sp. I52.16.1 TaxID=2928472 RepID=UPI001FCFBB05|nr:branched-chain amino acid ABC transporter permease [Acuticoccus sp. I52.16.1]UOM36143.1 branched-chain amino acid ABC transporter permease [Acuticoccus sp. I52.16.1]